MWQWFLSINVFAKSTLIPVYALGGLLILLLILRLPILDRAKPQNASRTPGIGRWLIWAVAAVILGGLIGLLVLWLVLVVYDTFGGPVTPETWGWGIALFAATGLVIANLFRTRIWRKVVALLTVPFFLVATALGINASFGLNPTVGAMLDISLEPQISLTKPNDAPDPKQPLWKTWKAPANMPAVGKTGVVYIEPKVSGFKARPAGVYLPPAALTENPPKLPFYLLMMGQPGRPDPHYVEGIFNDFAKQHHGLAPIVLVADQVGPAQADTLCVNSAKFGRVEDYIAKDVVSWARQNLNILAERKYWTVAGYSNGGQCAISFAAKYPATWGNVVDISGEEFPGAEQPAANLANIFNGDQAAYDAEKPINIMAKQHYPDTHAVFTVGSDDSLYVAQAKRVSQAAKAAGMVVDYHEVPNGGHLIAALAGGLKRGLQVLNQRWGLSP